MNEPVVDLAGWWPLVPPDNYTQPPAWVKNLLYLHACLILPTMDYGPNIRTHFAVYLTGISGSGVELSMTIDNEGPWPWTPLAICVGKDTSVMPLAGGALFAEYPSTESGVMYEVHPGCIDLLPTAPSLLFRSRDDVSKIDGLPDEQHPGQRQDGQPVRGAAVRMRPIAVEDGNNVSVSVVDGDLVFNGAALIGAGPWTVSPYNDLDALASTPGKGLRSINGISGAVTMDGGEDVSVSVSVTDSHPGLARAVQVTLIPKV